MISKPLIILENKIIITVVLFFVIKIDNLHQQMLSKRRHHASMSVQLTSCEHSHTKPRRKSESASCAQQALNTK